MNQNRPGVVCSPDAVLHVLSEMDYRVSPRLPDRESLHKESRIRPDTSALDYDLCDGCVPVRSSVVRVSVRDVLGSDDSPYPVLAIDAPLFLPLDLCPTSFRSGVYRIPCSFVSKSGTNLGAMAGPVVDAIRFHDLCRSGLILALLAGGDIVFDSPDTERLRPA